MRAAPAKKIAVILLGLTLLIAAPGRLWAATSDADIAGAWERAVDYSYEHPAILNDWPWLYALALGSQGEELAASAVITPSVASPTALANSIIGLLAQGENPAQVTIGGEPVNLVTALQAAQDAGGRFGGADATLNNTLWAVIALDMYNRHYPDRQVSYGVSQAVAYIESRQQPDGSFDESGWGADADSTAHALIALASHVTEDAAVIQSALGYLATKQVAGGGIDNNWGDSPASTAAVIEALLMLGLDPQSGAWTKDGYTLMDGLLEHQQPDGSFNEDMGGYSVDSTAFALSALADLRAGRSKYQGVFPLPASSNRVISVTPALPLTAGQDCDLTIEVRNTQVTTQDTLLIAALYDPSGRMTTYSYGQYRLAAGATQRVGLGFAVTTAAGSQVRVMAWDNWQNREPLCTPVSIPVQ